jgi:hypothetical protein
MSTGTAVATADARPVLATGGRIQPVIPQTMEDAYRLGKAICAAGMAPRGMETPEKCMVAILRGLEVGLSPMQAVDKIAVVNGRPTIWGDGAMALVRASGLCEFVRERIEGEGEGRVAICETKRKGETESIIRKFSVAQAKEAGLWNKQGPWKQFPDRMLQMRARAFALRDLYADVLGGLYLREEIEDERRQDGPSAPPPPAEARPQEIAPPSRTITGPAAPPAEAVEEAEIVLPPSPEQEKAAEAEHPPLAQEDVFDPEAWLEEAKGHFDAAKTASDVDDVHEMFGDTANELGMTDRQKYQDMHEAAVARVQVQPGPEQAEVTGEPGPAPDDEDDDTIPSDPVAPVPPQKTEGELYIERIRSAIKAPGRTYKAVGDLWNATKPERLALIASGEITKAQSKELFQAIMGLDGQDQAAAPAGPETPPPPAEEDEITAYDRSFRARVEACATLEEISALSAGTLGERAKFAGNPLQAVWKGLVADRRKAINGLS